MKRINNLPVLALILFLFLFLPLLVLAEKPDSGSVRDEFPSKALLASPKQHDEQATNLEAYQRAKAAQSLAPFHVVVPPAAFTSDGAAPDAFRIDADFGYLRGMHAASSMWAPLYLPRDAVISSLEVRLEDWDAQPGNDACVYLDRMNLETGEYECCLAELCSYGGDGEYVTLVENNISAPVVTDLYAYQINLYGLYPDTYIFGMRVGYAFAEHLPAVISD
jgi:hypothetical protein